MQTVIALGFFDGVHLGHGDLLARAAALAAERGWRSAALTFDRSPGKDGRLLSSVADRVRLIRGLYGVDEVFALPFSEEFRRMDWERFLESLVRDRAAACFVCGWNYRFGWRGAGDAEALRGWCAARGLGCEIIGPRVIDGVTVSSTHLKALIEAGDVETAARFYGHPHLMSGTVRTGRGLGHTLGFPTANLLPAPELVLPRDGVYAVQATLDDSGGQAMLVPTAEPNCGSGGQAMLVPTAEPDCGSGGQAMLVPTAEPGCGSGGQAMLVPAKEDGGVAHTVRRRMGVCNIGTRPTVGGHRRTVETWLEGFDGDLYGRELSLEFYRFLRPEQSFPDLEALRAQVERDKAAALAYFADP